MAGNSGQNCSLVNGAAVIDQFSSPVEVKSLTPHKFILKVPFVPSPMDILAVCQRLVSEGPTFVIVEQNLRAVLRLATRVYVLNNGHIVLEGTPAELNANSEITSRYIGI